MPTEAFFRDPASITRLHHFKRNCLSHTGGAEEWNTLLELDELKTHMKAGQLLHGFREGSIRFPPSFRWRRKAFAGSFDNMSTLRGAYTTDKKGEPRPPSYTDR